MRLQRRCAPHLAASLTVLVATMARRPVHPHASLMNMWIIKEA
jgi:hypothetical protein